MPTRRGLLALPMAGALAAPASAQEPSPMRRRLATLRLGANLERWYTITKDNQPRRLGLGWWRGFRAAGFDHVRIFLPEMAQTGSSMDIPALYLNAVKDAVEAGLPVFLGMADFYYQKKPWSERDWEGMRARARFFAERTDPSMVVLAALNEPVFDDNASWLPVRDRLLADMRRAAPQHMLMWGGHEWNSARSLIGCSLPADPNTIAEAHDYQGTQSPGRFQAVAAWRDRNRIPVIVSELGGAFGHETNWAAWAADLARVLPELKQLRLPATLWSYSHGSHWRMQNGDEPMPKPDLIPPGMLSAR